MHKLQGFPAGVTLFDFISQISFDTSDNRRCKEDSARAELPYVVYQMVVGGVDTAAIDIEFSYKAHERPYIGPRHPTFLSSPPLYRGPRGEDSTRNTNTHRCTRVAIQSYLISAGAIVGYPIVAIEKPHLL